jgi:hypothetical protein
MDKHNIKSRIKLQTTTGGNNILIQKISKQTKMTSGNKNMITKNYITQNIRSMSKHY